MNPVYVFLVDDDEDDRMLFETALQESAQNCVVKMAANGMDALEMMSSDDFEAQHVIFLDINMPRMDGKELLPKIKQLRKHAATPVIVYSTSASDQDVKLMLDAGAYTYLIKPNTYKGLCSDLVRMLEELKLS